MTQPRVTGSFPFFFIRTYPSPTRLKVVVAILSGIALMMLIAAAATYGWVAKSNRTQGAPTTTAVVKHHDLETDHDGSTVLGHTTYLSLQTPRGAAELDLDVEATVPANNRIAIKQDPRDPSYVELPGYPQNSARLALGLAGFAPVFLVVAWWFARRERRLIAGGEPVRLHAVLAALIVLALAVPTSYVMTGAPGNYPEHMSLAPAPG